MNKWLPGGAGVSPAFKAFAGGALVAGVGVAALLLGLPGVQAAGGVVAVHAVDYAYQGVPATLPAGETRFSFTNDSKAESHEMSLYRINDGVSESFDQILADDEARENQGSGQQGGQQGGQNPPADKAPPPPKMTYFGGNGAGAGNAAKMDLIGNLPPGRYGMVCFLPVANDQSGTSHYKKGMKAEFTVQ